MMFARMCAVCERHVWSHLCSIHIIGYSTISPFATRSSSQGYCRMPRVGSVTNFLINWHRMDMWLCLNVFNQTLARIDSCFLFVSCLFQTLSQTFPCLFPVFASPNLAMSIYPWTRWATALENCVRKRSLTNWPQLTPMPVYPLVN